MLASTRIYTEGIDAYCGKTEDLISREPTEIETSRIRHFEDNRLNCVVEGLNNREKCF